MQPSNNTPVDGPLYRPYRWAGADFQLGLRPIRPESWILMGPGHAELLRRKRERLDDHRPFFYRTLPDSLPAQRELRERVTTHLVTDHAGSFEKSGSVVRSLVSGQTLDLDDESTEPLLQVSYLIEEDFMLLQEIGGTLRITAASNAYSSSGRLVTSVGHDMANALTALRNIGSLKPTIARVRKALDNLKRAGILAKPGGSYIVEDRLFAEYLATITDSAVSDPIPKSVRTPVVVGYRQKSRDKK
jgi:dimethylamine monooxygenase subunit A